MSLSAYADCPVEMGGSSRIKYVIHNKQMWRSYAHGNTAAWDPAPYGGANPHTKHVHISVNDKKALYDSVAEWDLSELAGTKNLLVVPTGVFSTVDLKIAWGAKVPVDFKAKVIEISGKLKVDPSYLMAAMAFETGQSFKASTPGLSSTAVGLIQFMPQTAVALGTTSAALAVMTEVQQLDYVEKYLKPYAGKFGSIYDLYMAILWPAAVSKPVSHVLFAQPSKQYLANKGLDTNNDGKVTKAEAGERVQKMLIQGLQIGNLG